MPKSKWTKNKNGCIDFCMEVFVATWMYLESLCKERQVFAICWILKNEDMLQIFISDVLGLKCEHFSKRLLYNGYNHCSISKLHLFSSRTWIKIDNLFSNHLYYSCIPKWIRNNIALLTNPNLEEIRQKKSKDWEKALASQRQYSIDMIRVKKLNLDVVRECMGYFLGVPDEGVLEKFEPGVFKLFRMCPTEFLVMEKRKNYTYFFDRSGGTATVIAMIISRPSELSDEVKSRIRALLHELFMAHNAIIRSVASFDSDMVGHEPFFHRFKKGKDIVSFYTSKLKLKGGLKGGSPSHLKNAEAFQSVVDRHTPSELIDILLGLYLWWCPQFLSTFLEFSRPYLDGEDYDPIPLEQVVTTKGPSAYQLYISRDYCSELHADTDATDFTLCYASHPDSDISPIDFVIGDYGLRFDVRDTNVYAFRSDIPHGTVYRQATTNATYVGCLAVNNRLGNLIRRRRA